MPDAHPALAAHLEQGPVRTQRHIRALPLQGGTRGAPLAPAGLGRLGLEQDARLVPLDPAPMVPSAGPGIVGITMRPEETGLHNLLAGIGGPEARAVPTAERALLPSLAGPCLTSIGGYARLPPGALHLTGLVARADGTFLRRRTTQGAAADAARMGAERGAGLRAVLLPDIFVG